MYNHKYDIYINSLNYVIESIEDIGNIEFLKSNKGLLDKYRKDGFKDFSRSGRSAMEMAAECAIKIVNGSSIRKDEIDLIILDTNAYRDSSFDENSLNKFMLDIGLNNVPIIVSCYPACVGFTNLMWQAQEYIYTGRYKNILVITSNKCHKEDGRVMVEYGSIGSDASAGCIVSTLSGEYTILSYEVGNEPNYSTYKFPNESIIWAFDALSKFKETFDSVTNAAGCSLSDIDAYSFDNINNSYLLFQLEEYGIDIGDVYNQNISRISHTYSADNFINLFDLINTNKICKDELVLVHNASHMMWGAFVVKRT